MNEPRFDWGAIFRAGGITVLVAGGLGLLVPIVGALADGEGPLTTLNISGNEIYRWGYWAIAWGMLVWQGNWMLRVVGDKIIDDMLVIGILVALVLSIIKVVIWIIYQPQAMDGTFIDPFTTIDAGGALLCIVVALVAARANRY
jgi:hypothetical protein